MPTIGTCSICGGAVTVSSAWGSIIPQVPSCSSCGAKQAQHGAVIPMVPAKKPETLAKVFQSVDTGPISSGWQSVRDNLSKNTGD